MIGLSTTPWHNTHLPQDQLQHVHAPNLLSSNNGTMCVAISSHFHGMLQIRKEDTLWHRDDPHSLNCCNWFQNIQTITFPHINLSCEFVVFLRNHDIVYHFENQQKTFTFFNPQPSWWF
jgi:hypothetical protein